MTTPADGGGAGTATKCSRAALDAQDGLVADHVFDVLGRLCGRTPARGVALEKTSPQYTILRFDTYYDMCFTHLQEPITAEFFGSVEAGTNSMFSWRPVRAVLLWTADGGSRATLVVRIQQHKYSGAHQTHARARPRRHRRGGAERAHGHGRSRKRGRTEGGGGLLGSILGIAGGGDDSSSPSSSGSEDSA